MNISFLFATLVIVASACRVCAQNAWKPSQGPLMTRWAKEVSPSNALREYPRPQMVRDQWQNLNGLWDYTLTEKNGKVPNNFDGQILVPYPIESALSGVMKALQPDQKIWYRRSFTIPPAWQGQKVLLHFGAADWDATVFINGTMQGSHRGGYDSFSFDITKSLKNDVPNEITVAVSDPTDSNWQLRGKQTLSPGGAAYTATSGIWQTVWLEPVPQSSIEKLKMVPNLKDGNLQLTVSGRTPPGKTNIEITVSDGKNPIASAKTVLGNELSEAIMDNLAWYKATEIGVISQVSVPIPNIHLWTPDDPFLYDIIVRLKNANGQTLDTVRSYFGMRSLSVGHDEKNNTRLMFNNRPLIMAGALDQGFWPDGIYTAPTDDALRFDVEAAKRLGLNAIRKHIKIEPERYYYWCDKLGLLVLQDLPSGYAGNPSTDAATNPEGSLQNEMEMRTIIQQNWNHPSIIMWIMFNEGWGQHDTLRTALWAKELDPTRLIDEASGFPHHGGGDVYDVHGGIAPKSPSQVSLSSETMGSGLAVPGHAWPGKAWALGTYDPVIAGETLEASSPLYPVTDESKQWYTRNIRRFYRNLWANKDLTGMSGEFKVQLYDVENETNGFLSYDREVWKVAPEEIAPTARGEQLPENVTYLLPTSKIQQTTWHYTTATPDTNWTAPNFDDSKWQSGRAGFGGEVGDGRSGTPWTSSDIWLRQKFSLPNKPRNSRLRIVHDENVEVYINGVLATREGGFTTAFDDYSLLPEALKTLKAGLNTIAVHCKQTTGGQGVDVGLVDTTQNR